MPKLHNGLLITLEGIDGSGKSTLARNLADALTNLEYRVVLTKEPGGSPLGKKLRPILQEKDVAVDARAEYLLFAADRAQHFCDVIIPALAAKKIIISDRMADSSLVYQGYGRGLDKELIKQVNAWAMHNINPDLTLYIKISADQALDRLKSSRPTLTSFEKEGKSFLEKLIFGFDDIYKNRTNVIQLDGSLTIEKITTTALAALHNILPAYE